MKIEQQEKEPIKRKEVEEKKDQLNFKRMTY